MNQVNAEEARKRRNRIERLIYVVVFVLMTLSFGANFFGVAAPEEYDFFLITSEDKQIGRLVMSQREGLLSYGGLEGRMRPEGLSGFDAIQFHFSVYLDDLPYEGEFSTYKSQSNFQGIVFAILDRVLPIGPAAKIAVFRCLVAGILALVLLAIVRWAQVEIGVGAALVLLLFFFFSKWTTLMGRNITMIAWPMFISVAMVLWALRKQVNNDVLFVVIFIATLLKCLFGGYNYVTTTSMMALVPIVYYAIVRREELIQTVRKLIFGGLSIVAAGLVSLHILILQVSSVTGSWFRGFEHVLITSILRRTYGESDVIDTERLSYKNVDFGAMMDVYILKRKFSEIGFTPGIGFGTTYIILFGVIALAFFYAGWAIWRNSPDQRRFHGLMVATILGFAASMSWHVVFRNHSWQHDHLNSVLWDQGVLIFGGMLIGLCLEKIIRAPWTKVYS